MPNSMLDLDTNFPNFSGEQSTDAKLAAVQNYLYMLVEQLRYSLRNLDLTNWNGSALEDWSGRITEPIYGRIEDGEGRMNRFEADAEGFRGRLSDAEGNILSLTATAEGLKSSVSDAEGRLSVIEQTAESITTTVGELGGSYSQLRQTVDGFTFTDEDGKVWINNGSLRLTGSITWADLSPDAQSAISGSGVSEERVREIAGTVITRELVASPTIQGAKLFATGSEDSYMEMEQDGLRLYIDGIDEPKFEITVDRFSTMPLITVGAGDNSGNNRFYMVKYPTYLSMHYDEAATVTLGRGDSGGGVIKVFADTLDLSGVKNVIGLQ